MTTKLSPGTVRDAIVTCLEKHPSGASLEVIGKSVSRELGETPASSIRSYLRLNTPGTFRRVERGRYALAKSSLPTEPLLPLLFQPEPPRQANSKRNGSSTKGITLVHEDCFSWLAKREPNSIHAVVTDPPYGLVEYSAEEQEKMRARKGGVWRIPPSFDGHQRSPLPRFTTLTAEDLQSLERFFREWARLLHPVLVPGAHVLIASNPLLSYVVTNGVVASGFERRGEVIRLTMTMRGGDRPKAAHEEFNDVSVMPRSMWEPWLIFRKPVEGRVQDNLRKWRTGGFRRPSPQQPFGDVIASAPTRASERAISPHPSLKPQAFMRQIVRAVLPLGEGVVLDPFAGGGSTLAAAKALGYSCIGIEKDAQYYRVAEEAIERLAALP